ncbi:YqeB family protein [Evansella halocellulosilytica]|uniref:YqeB family protein n=1 Tax=Evansella halocellulosilytica TaxID=2011013 RepID=UPI00211B8B41|nr:hypothetical protein [Evansella halocellulosilytica]
MDFKTVLGLSKVEKLIIIILPPILGGVVGWFGQTVAYWLSKIPFIPFGGPLNWYSALENPWIPIISGSAGLLAGILFTIYAFSESLKMTISDKELELHLKNKVEIFAKKDIFALFIEGKKLVLLDHHGNELFRGQFESKKDHVEESLKRHNYPLKMNDPYENQYQRWVKDHPDFSGQINTLLSDRYDALKKGEQEEIQSLRKDLVKLGVIVKDEDDRQYVRKVES